MIVVLPGRLLEIELGRRAQHAVLDDFWWTCGRQKETLGSVAAEGRQLIELGLGLDAFSDDTHPKGVG